MTDMAVYYSSDLGQNIEALAWLICVKSEKSTKLGGNHSFTWYDSKFINVLYTGIGWRF